MGIDQEGAVQDVSEGALEVELEGELAVEMVRWLMGVHVVCSLLFVVCTIESGSTG